MTNLAVEPTNTPTGKSTKQKIIFYTMLGILAFIGGGLLGLILLRVVSTGSIKAPHEFHGFILETPEVLGEFTLNDPAGHPVNLSDFRGQVTLVYYGYRHCPDICPATLSELTNMMETLGSKSDQVQVIMVSVDPERDSPEKLAEYVSYFHSDFIGLTGTPDELTAATVPYGIFYEKHEGTDASGYLIDHSAGVLLFDRQGYLKEMFPFGIQGEKIATDVEYFLRPPLFR